MFVRVLFISLLLLSSPARAADDQHLVINDKDIQSTRHDPAVDLKSNTESLRNVEQRLDKIKKDAEALKKQEGQQSSTVFESQSQLAEQQNAASLVQQTVELNRQRIDALGGLISDLRQARDEAAQELERRLALLYLAHLQAKNPALPGDAPSAIQTLTWQAAARYSALKIDGADETLRKSEAELQQVREILQHQETLAETTRQDSPRLQSDLADAQKGLREIEQSRAALHDEQSVLESRQQTLHDLLSLLEEKRRLMEQRQQAASAPATQPASNPADQQNDQHLVLKDDEVAALLTPTPVPAPAATSPISAHANAMENANAGANDEATLQMAAAAAPATGPAKVVESDSNLPGIEVETDGARPVFVVAKGEVKFAGELRGFDQIVVLQQDGGYFTVYAHLSRSFVQEGETLAAGDVVGMSGALPSAKNGWGARFEVRRGDTAIDPAAWPQLPRDAANILVHGKRR